MERNRQLADARAGSWLGEGSSTVQQQALRDFDQAMRNWWGGTHRYPTWRKQGRHEGFRVVDVVSVEDLNVKGMTRSAKGTVEAPGRNVRAKAGLNRSILEQGWGIFQQRLGHKIGDRLVVVPAAYTSQRCSCCGNRDAKSRESQARYVCRSCGHSEHADVNAARNIAAAGQAVWGAGEVVTGVDPEPQLPPSGGGWNPRPSGRGGCQGTELRSIV